MGRSGDRPRSPARRRVPVAWAVAAAMGGGPLLTACAGPEPSAAACTVAQAAHLDTLQTGVAGGTLRHGFSVTNEAGQLLVSAELHPAGEDPDHDGDILTWITADPASGQFLAVDAHAREESTWAPAGVDVRVEGAITSRGCVLTQRGSPTDQQCQAGFEAFC